VVRHSVDSTVFDGEKIQYSTDPLWNQIVLYWITYIRDEMLDNTVSYNGFKKFT